MATFGGGKRKYGEEDGYSRGMAAPTDVIEQAVARMAGTKKPKEDQSDDVAAHVDDLSARRASAGGASTSAPVAVTVDLEALERAAAANGGNVVERLDVRGVKRIVLGFERRLKENLEARMKHAEQPDRFLDSEVDLAEEIKRMHALAAAPELYPELVRLGAIQSILSLMTHENTDIAIEAIDLIRDLTDEDVAGAGAGDDGEGMRRLVDALLEGNMLELLVQSLFKLDEKVPDEAQAVHGVLSIVENLVEVKPEVAARAVETTRLLRWLLTRLRQREFDPLKQYAAEILAILLQTGTASSQKRLGAIGGIDALLQAIAPYKGRDATTADEREMVENMFNALCCALLPPENRLRFVKAEGIELMLLILKNRRQARDGAIRTMDFALTDCVPASERFVDVLGLKTAFSVFMGKARPATQPGKKKRNEEMTEDEEEERAVSIMASLFNNITNEARRIRLASKFVENEHEKVDRLMELYFKYATRVQEEEVRQQRLIEEGDDEAPQVDEEKLLARMDKGLFTLQLLALICGHLWGTRHPGIQDRIKLLLHQQGGRIEFVADVLREYTETLSSDGPGGEEERKRRVAKARELIQNMDSDTDNDEDGDELKKVSTNGNGRSKEGS